MADGNPTTIEEVLNELDLIVETTIQNNSPLGIFAYVYRRTTAKVAEGINDGRFENGRRMEIFDVAFAQKYLDAFRANERNEPVSSSWQLSFDAVRNRRTTIMQHLLLGMNAHINLDLGIAAAEVAPGSEISALENDFMTINQLLAELIDEMQQRIGRVSPLLFMLDWIGKRKDEAIANFSITRARDFAWRFARQLAVADEREKSALIRQTDDRITVLGRLVADPPGFATPGILSLVRYFEEKDTRRVIEELKKET